MTWTPRICSPDDPAARAAWHTLWTQSPQRTAFASLDFADALRQALGYSYRLALLSETGAPEASPQAGALVFERRLGPFRKAVIPPFTQYTSLLFATDVDEAALQAGTAPFGALLESLAAAYAWLQFHLVPELADVRPAAWEGWQVRPFYTYRLRLTDRDQLLAGWSAGTRRTYRAAAGRYEVREQAADARAVIRLCAARYAQQGRAFPADVPRLQALVAALCRRGRARVFTAFREQQQAPEGGLVVLHDDRTAHYWIAGSRPGAAMTVLLGDVLPRLHAEGLTTFDFVGANTPSIAEFKRRFGPVLTPYYRIEKITHRGLRMLHPLATAWRRPA